MSGIKATVVYQYVITLEPSLLKMNLLICAGNGWLDINYISHNTGDSI